MHSIPLLFTQIWSLKDFFSPLALPILTKKFRQKTKSIYYSLFHSFCKVKTRFHFFYLLKIRFFGAFRDWKKTLNMLQFFLSSGVKRLKFEISIYLICFKSSMSKNFHRFTKAWFKNFTAMLLPLILGDGFLWQCVSC